MEFCPGPGVFDFHEMRIVAGDNSAFAHWLAHCGGTGPDGVLKTCWMRVSAGYQRVGGEWKVVHEHWSAPFDMETGAGLFDLKP
jgi:ketosteroid isomerase-like protein